MDPFDVLRSKSLTLNVSQVDTVMTAKYSKIERTDIARKLTDWELAGTFVTLPWVANSHHLYFQDTRIASLQWSERYDLSPQILCHSIFTVHTSSQRYMVVNPLPKTSEGIQALADLIYERMLAREEEAVQKLKQVIDFATGDDCTSPNMTS